MNCKNFRYLAFLLLLFSGKAFCVEIPKGRYKIAPDKDYVIPYLSSYPLDQENKAIRHVIIGIHGSGGGTWSIFNCCNKMVNANQCKEHTLVWTPQFPGGCFKPQIEKAKENNLLFWKGRYLSWTWGQRKASVIGAEDSLEISTFEIMENMITDLCQKKYFPNITHITITGNSAGGQFTQRFAVFNTVEDGVAKSVGVTLRYVPMNPLSYVYLDPKRPADFKHQEFAVPTSESTDAIALMKKRARNVDEAEYQRLRRVYKDQLSWYNNYGYGLEKLPYWHEKKNLSPEQIRQQYKQRTVFYIVGGEDNSLYRTSHEISAVLLQGRTRRERARNYYGHLLDVYGRDITDKQKLIVIPKANHGTSSIMLNGIARNYILVKYRDKISVTNEK